ncbi:MAG: TerB N-terminal domain-containing protein [Bilifractor sp.]
MAYFERTANDKRTANVEENNKDITVVLDHKSDADNHVYGDTPLPFASTVTRGQDRDKFSGKNFTENNRAARSHTRETTAPAGTAQVQEVPEKILAMIRLYEYGDGSLLNKSKNFYQQGKFMDDYEDHVPWNGTLQRYFTTYHDLNLRQLRGYFTWRTKVRRGEYTPISTSLAYMYIYELLCGIGSDSPEDTLRRIRDFGRGYLDSGIGDRGMYRNLHRWSLEYAVLHALPKETILQYADPAVLEKDHALTVLKHPDEYTDDAVFSALVTVGETKLKDSPVLKADAAKDTAKEELLSAKGKHLFSAVWRRLSAHYQQEGKDIFTACFGQAKAYRWYPLSNAVYYEPYEPSDTDFALDECRSYHFHNGVWEEKRYDQLYCDKDKLHAIIHEADRYFRRYLKTGHYTKKKPEEAWVSPYVEAVLEAEHQAEIEAARPKVSIDFSRLEGIRRDAIVTRDSLLTDEEKSGTSATFADLENTLQKKNTASKYMNAKTERAKTESEEPRLKPERTKTEPEELKTEPEWLKKEPAEPEGPANPEALFSKGGYNDLNPLYLQLLTDLLSGKNIRQKIAENRLMPSIVTDTINEVFFDEIGDNILECDGSQITIVEDYRDDLINLLQ